MSFLSKIEGHYEVAAKTKPKAYKVVLTIVTPGTFKPFQAKKIQTPGPISELGKYDMLAEFDPWVESIFAEEIPLTPKMSENLN